MFLDDITESLLFKVFKLFNKKNHEMPNKQRTETKGH